MSDLMFKAKYLKDNWKLIVHLLFRTQYFGVNNQWKSDFPSMFGWPKWKIIWSIITVRPIIMNYRYMRFRAQIGFIPRDVFMKLFRRFTMKHMPYWFSLDEEGSNKEEK